jgi:hypothetical protein
MYSLPLAKSTANGFKISLYKTSFIGKRTIVGSVTERLVDFEPRNQGNFDLFMSDCHYSNQRPELDRMIPIAGGKSITITLRVGETVFRSVLHVVLMVRADVHLGPIAAPDAVYMHS